MDEEGCRGGRFAAKENLRGKSNPEMEINRSDASIIPLIPILSAVNAITFSSEKPEVYYTHNQRFKSKQSVYRELASESMENLPHTQLTGPWHSIRGRPFSHNKSSTPVYNPDFPLRSIRQPLSPNAPLHSLHRCANYQSTRHVCGCQDWFARMQMRWPVSLLIDEAQTYGRMSEVPLRRMSTPELRRLQREERRQSLLERDVSRKMEQPRPSKASRSEIRIAHSERLEQDTRFVLLESPHPAYRRSLIPEALRVAPVPSQASLNQESHSRSAYNMQQAASIVHIVEKGPPP